MPIIRAQVSHMADTTQARDAFVITPHFNVDTAAGTLPFDPTALATDLVTGLKSITGVTGELRCRVYDAADPAPNLPLGEHVADAGTVHSSRCAREVACCISYYSEFNVPRRRGRLYIPGTWLIASGAQVRPPHPSATLDGIVDLLLGLGGANVDFGVYSRMDGEFRKATVVWYDNEWDIQRSRGLRGDARKAVTTSE